MTALGEGRERKVKGEHPTCVSKEISSPDGSPQRRLKKEETVERAPARGGKGWCFQHSLPSQGGSEGGRLCSGLAWSHETLKSQVSMKRKMDNRLDASALVSSRRLG